MFSPLIILAALWSIRTFKNVLFWIYLWQLKEYHIGRFKNHFTTEKGKKLLYDPTLLLKIVLVLIFAFLPQFQNALLIIVLAIYVIEGLIFSRQVARNTHKRPVITFKSLFLTSLVIIISIIFLFWVFNKNLVWYLGFDIALPIIVSVVILAFQPISVLLRNRKLKQAKRKLENYPNLKVIAITGSYGKTATKEFLTTILSQKFNVLSTTKHQNSEIGIANCILQNLNKHHQIFIAEVGAYNKGKVKEVCNVIKPKLGIVTGVNEQHLALFGSLENLLLAEGGGELAQILEGKGELVVNGDNKYCLSLLKKFNGKEKIYTKENRSLNADIWTESSNVQENHISFVARDKKGQMCNFYVNVLGKQQIENLLGSILAASELGMSFNEISEACKQIVPEQAGMTASVEKHGIHIIDSSYSSNPNGVKAELDYLNIYKRKKVVVMPCLIELGKDSKRIHEEIGKKIGKICSLAIITSKDYFEQIKKGAKESGMKDSNIILCDKAQDIYSLITLYCKAGDAVLLEGRVPTELINLLK
jgi:UDP-N-acetylmuramoyl-tripeptide--D-alanyl-D-alanine ligase